MQPNTSGFLPHTISYVTYDIVCLDIRYRMSGVGCRIRYRMYDIVYTILHCWTYDIVCTISYVLRYRMSTCDVVCTTYDIVLPNEYITYTISYVCKYMRYRMSVMYDIVCAYRIPYRMSCTISYVDIRYRI